MPRRYHSASSIALGKRCQRAWAEVYLAGRRDDDVPWDAVANYRYDRASGLFRGDDGGTCTAKQRSTALGKATHAVLETHYRGGKPDWYSLPGRIAHSGLPILPRRDACETIAEQPIGRTPSAPLPGERDDAPTQVLMIDGVAFAGYRDLLVHGSAELARLGIRDDHAVIDYKTTASIERYALSPDDLESDGQASIYTIDACEALGVDAISLRWAYLESKDSRRSWPCDVRMTLARARENMAPLTALARELDRLERVEDAPQNVHACADYGPPGRINCPHHTINGGTCNARRSLGSLVQARVRKDRPMAISADMKAKFQKAKAQAPEKKAPIEAEAPAPVSEPEPEKKAPIEAEAPAPVSEPEVTSSPKKKSGGKTRGPDALDTDAGKLVVELAELVAKQTALTAELATVRASIKERASRLVEAG